MTFNVVNLILLIKEILSLLRILQSDDIVVSFHSFYQQPLVIGRKFTNICNVNNRTDKQTNNLTAQKKIPHSFTHRFLKNRALFQFTNVIIDMRILNFFLRFSLSLSVHF